MVERLEPFLSQEKIAERVKALAVEIQAHYLKDGPMDEPLLLVCVLKGSVVFFADLLRQLDMPTHVAFLGLSSYEGGTHSTGAVRLTHDLTAPLAGRDCVIVEDIVDTGLTMSYLLDMLRARKPRSLKVCSLLHKPSQMKIKVPIDWVGFSIENRFVVGYGLDYEQRYRNLPYIGVLKLGE